MALCQNESENMESIREAKTIYTHATQEVNVLCSTTIKEVKAACAQSIQEAEKFVLGHQRSRSLWSLSGGLASTVAC